MSGTNWWGRAGSQGKGPGARGAEGLRAFGVGQGGAARRAALGWVEGRRGLCRSGRGRGAAHGRLPQLSSDSGKRHPR